MLGQALEMGGELWSSDILPETLNFASSRPMHQPLMITGDINLPKIGPVHLLHRASKRTRNRTMTDGCAKHQFNLAIDVCRTCGDDFCGECLIYPFGPDKIPFCLDCALAASGVRSATGRSPRLSKKHIKARHDAWLEQRQVIDEPEPAQQQSVADELDRVFSEPFLVEADANEGDPFDWIEDPNNDQGDHGDRTRF